MSTERSDAEMGPEDSASNQSFPPEVLPVDPSDSTGKEAIHSEDTSAVIFLEEEELAEVLPAPPPPHPNFWWSILWSFGFLMVLYGTVFAVVFSAVFIKAIVSSIQNREGQIPGFQQAIPFRGAGSEQAEAVPTARLMESVPGLPVALFLGELVSLVFAFAIIRRLIGKDWMRILGLRRPSLSQLILVLIGFPGMLVLPDFIHKAATAMGVPSYQNPEELGRLFGQWPLAFAVLVVGVGPGLSEELWCRGFLGRGLVGNYGPWLGILLTSMLFGALHVDPAQAVATAFMGLWLHFSYLTSRSLWIPMLLHTLNNSVGVIAGATGDSTGSQSGQAGHLDPILDWIITFLQAIEQAETSNSYLVFLGVTCLIAAVAWALYEARTRLVTRDESLRPPWRPDYPGVEYPPPGSSTVVWRPWPGWQASGIVLVGVLIFALSIYLAPSVVIP
jgi:membrane protease YdiL (CAAX protease family)